MKTSQFISNVNIIWNMASQSCGFIVQCWNFNREFVKNFRRLLGIIEFLSLRFSITISFTGFEFNQWRLRLIFVKIVFYDCAFQEKVNEITKLSTKKDNNQFGEERLVSCC